LRRNPRDRRLCDRHWSFTLIEVVAALVLLGGTVVALLVGQSRALEQVAASQRLREAAHLAEELLSEWALQDQEVTTGAEGTFDEWPGWSWQRTVEPGFLSEGGDLLGVRLDIICTGQLGQTTTVASFVCLEMPDVAGPLADVEP
jgi:type II secretory pathway pseudopilin PulG